MKVALVLPTAMGISSDEGRILQFAHGFNQIAELVRKYPLFDVFVVDNTISSNVHLDNRIAEAIDTIPTLKEKIFFNDNEYGKKNKGAGLIVAWKKVLEKIPDSYDYVISFEPRQELKDFSFFERFVASPGVYVRLLVNHVWRFKIVPMTITQMWTGLVVLSPKDMKEYCDGINMKQFVFLRTSIETDLYGFIQKKGIATIEVPNLGILWHDVANSEHLLI